MSQALLARESDACQSYLDADQRANAQQLQLKNTKSNSPFLPAKFLSVQHAASPRRVSSNFSEVVALLQQTECAETRAEVGQLASQCSSRRFRCFYMSACVFKRLNH
jgi:hypothetical protein